MCNICHHKNPCSDVWNLFAATLSREPLMWTHADLSLSTSKPKANDPDLISVRKVAWSKQKEKKNPCHKWEHLQVHSQPNHTLIRSICLQPLFPSQRSHLEGWSWRRVSGPRGWQKNKKNKTPQLAPPPCSLPSLYSCCQCWHGSPDNLLFNS